MKVMCFFILVSDVVKQEDVLALIFIGKVLL